MAHSLRVMLVEEVPAKGRGRTKPLGKILDSFEVEIADEKEGVEIVEELGGFLEEEFDKEIFECE